jgi:hypothetical protein
MALLDFYGMFDYTNGDGDVYEYTSAEWSKLIEAMTSNGVSADSFTMTANGLTITVGGGTGFINGRYGYNDKSTTLTLTAESTSLQRIDRIVLELNVSNRTMELKIVKGTAASSAVAPSLTQTSLVYQLPLYQAKITNGSTVTLTDERVISYTPTQVMKAFQTIQEEFEKIKSGDTTVYAVYA